MCITSIIFFNILLINSNDIFATIYLLPKSIPMQLRLLALKCVHTDSFPYFAYLQFITRYYNILSVLPLFIMNSTIFFCATAAHNDFLCRICYDIRKELTLTLFMLWVFTDNSDATFSFNDFAFFANRFN